MKLKLHFLAIGLFFLAGCSEMIVDSTPIQKDLSIKRQDNLRVAIYLDKKQQNKYYNFDGGDAFIYPAFSEKLKFRLKQLTKQIDVIYESNDKSNYLNHDIVIMPDWEIEQRNLHITLSLSYTKNGDSFSFSETTSIEERESWKAPIYLASMVTVVGLPIAMAIDDNDIAGKIEVALNEAILKLEDKYLPIISSTNTADQKTI